MSTFLIFCILFKFKLLHANETPLYKKPQLVVDALGFTGEKIRLLTISNDGKWLAAAGEKVIRIWSIQSGKLYATLRGYQEPYGYHVGYIDALCFSPGSRYLAVGVSDNTERGSTRLYDLSKPKSIHALIKGHKGCTREIAFSPNGNYMATCGCDGMIYFLQWDEKHGYARPLFDVNWEENTVKTPLLCRDKIFSFTTDSKWLLFCKGKANVVVSISSQTALTDSNRWPNEFRDLLTKEDSLLLPGGNKAKFTTPPRMVNLFS